MRAGGTQVLEKGTTLFPVSFLNQETSGPQHISLHPATVPFVLI